MKYLREHNIMNTVDLLIFACLNFRECLILGLLRVFRVSSLEFANFHFYLVALL